MDVVSISAGETSANSFEAGLPRLIQCVGFSAFESDLLDVARATIDCEHLAAFISDTEGARLVLAADREHSGLARKVGATFAARFWNEDPLTPLSNALNAGDALLVRFDEHDLEACAFRRRCYHSDEEWNRGGRRLIERLSLVLRRDRRILTLNLLRSVEQRSFSQDDARALVGAWRTLAALLERHAVTTFSNCHNAFRAHVAALTAAHPELPRREAEVGAGIVLGLSSEAMSLTLDISENTVRTYRKRIYARLKISSQNELIRKVLTHSPPEALGNPPTSATSNENGNAA